MINSITLAALRNAEFLQFSNDALSIVQRNDPAALSVTTWYNAFKTVTTEIDALFKTDQSSAITETLQELDVRRDNAINGILFTVQGYTYHFAPTTAAAAKILEHHLSVFGAGIARTNLQSETAILNSIVTDLKNKPELIGAIAALGMDSWVTELDTANKTFSTKYLDRTQEMGAVSPDTIKAKRLEGAAAWYKLRDKLNAYYEINEGAEPWAKTINDLNALTEQYNALINNRKGGDETQSNLPNQA